MSKKNCFYLPVFISNDKWKKKLKAYQQKKKERKICNLFISYLHPCVIANMFPFQKKKREREKPNKKETEDTGYQNTNIDRD